MTPPPFMINDGKNEIPTLIQRLYAGRKLQVWFGRARVSAIHGWADNPRITLVKKRLKQSFGDRDLTQDELFDVMKKEDEFKLSVLRDDIMKNGLRDPITLAFSGKLLDGNRRFYALKYVLQTLPPADPNRVDFESVLVYVLNDSATPEEEKHVLVEENFSPSLKLEWPDYIKAQNILEEFVAGKNEAEIAAKYNWTRRKVQETKRIGEIIHEFETLSMDPPNAEDEYGGGFGLSEIETQAMAAKNYQFFNEAQKSFFKELNSDLDFKMQFFKWIKEDKFKSFPEVRIAYKAWKDPEARAIIVKSDPNAAKDAKTNLEYNEKIIQGADEAAGRIETFVKFLKQLKVERVAALPKKTVTDLEDALKLVSGMTKAANTTETGNERTNKN